jgi:hypothetical protein
MHVSLNILILRCNNRSIFLIYYYIYTVLEFDVWKLNASLLTVGQVFTSLGPTAYNLT